MAGTEERSDRESHDEPVGRPAPDGSADHEAETGGGARGTSFVSSWSIWDSRFDDSPQYQSKL